MTGEGESDGSVQPERDESMFDVLKVVGKLVKLLRERAGLTQAQLGEAIGYGEDQVSAVERARRVPKPEFLDGTDEALGAGGMLSAMKEDVARARYPAEVRNLSKLEDQATEINAYDNHVFNGLLQTEDYARSLFKLRRPLLNEETIERRVEARMARQAIFHRWPAPILSFVIEEVVLHRPYGGPAVLHSQLETLLRFGQMRNVDIQVMPTDREDNGGMSGPFMLLEIPGRAKMAHTEGQMTNHLITDRKSVHAIEVRHGIIRAQALTPRESLALIEKLLGET